MDSLAFLYAQISGSFLFGGNLIALGFSGNGPGLNNPLWQGVKNHGPLPVGKYTIVPASRPHLGPIVFSLLPDPGNNMLTRSAFFIHWDTSQHDYTASDGCIIFRDMPVFQFIQKQVAAGNDKLEVVAMPPLIPMPAKETT